MSGPQITRGYLNLPDKTGAVFVPNPYCEGPGTHTQVMYKTGDLACWLPCGRIECMGRTDHQVRRQVAREWRSWRRLLSSRTVACCVLSREHLKAACAMCSKL